MMEHLKTQREADMVCEKFQHINVDLHMLVDLSIDERFSSIYL